MQQDETPSAKNHAPLYQNPVYDQHAKRLLAQRAIMARLLKRTVPEFAEASLADIAEKYIEGTPQISGIGVNRDSTNAARKDTPSPKEFFGDATESVGITEGWIRFDILFHARAPKSGELITLIINVEAQRTQRRSKLGYAILRRAVYYASRLISSQKETEFTGSSYDEIKKVYSIWLCMDSPDGTSAINRYNLEEHHILNGHKENRADYDLMSIVTIYLGEDQTANEDWLIRFLRLLFKDTNMPPARKKKVLKDEFDMDTTTDMEEELSTMCNLSTGIYEQGVERGIAQGMERGIAQGMERGIAQGMERGIAQGMERGIAQGMERGIAQGMERGMENTRKETALSMLKEKLPIEMIARITNLSADNIRALAKEHSLL